MAEHSAPELQDERLIDGLDSPGMRPAHQERSRKLVVALFGAGLDLLRTTDFDGLSVEALCARAGSTVGAFYSRFENKEAFVLALQRLVVEQTRRRIVADYQTDIAPRDSLAHLVGWIAKGATVWYRRHEGMIRASLRRSTGDAEMWTPLRELGGLQIAHALPRIVDFVPPDARHGAEQRAQFAFQMMFGTLNNLVLINPGPFTLDDPSTPRMLAAAMVQFIEGGPKASAMPGARRG